MSLNPFQSLSPLLSPIDPFRPSPNIQFQASSLPHNIMHRGEQIKPKRLPTSRDCIRSPQTQRQKHPLRHPQEAASLNYRIVIRQQKPRKGSDKLPAEKVQRPKRLKFITQGIEESTQELLSLRSRSNMRDRSAKLSPHNVEEENAYELLRASKRSHQGEGKGKERPKAEGEEKRMQTGNIKLRKEKSHSKDRMMVNVKTEIGGKGGKKTKNAAKSSRKSQKNLHPKRFLSPELVKLENSYYFSNYGEESSKGVPMQSFAVVSSNPTGTLAVPKKESKFIFESNQDFWNDPQSKRLLTSTLDLLN